MDNLQWRQSVFRDISELTEKWKHLKTVLSGKVNDISDCALASAHCRPVRRYNLALSFELIPHSALRNPQLKWPTFLGIAPNPNLQV